MATNPLIAQGTLNKVRCSIIIPANPSLNITASYMSKSMATVSLEGDISHLIPTGTGGVYSPEPFVMVSITAHLLRTQALTNSWRQQFEATANIGDIAVHSDTSAFPSYHFRSGVIQHFNQGSYDGEDPTAMLVMMAIYDVNSDMWNFQ